MIFFEKNRAVIVNAVGAVTLVFLVSMAGWSQRMPKALLITGNGNLPVAKENYPPWVHEFHNPKILEILKNCRSR